MTNTVKCSCGCEHNINSDVKDLLTSTKKCFVCGASVSFKMKKEIEAVEEITEENSENMSEKKTDKFSVNVPPSRKVKRRS